MKSTTWTCDNCCGQKVLGDNKPLHWLLLNGPHSTVFVLCGYPCLMEFAYKAINGIPLGDKVDLNTTALVTR